MLNREPMWLKFIFFRRCRMPDTFVSVLNREPMWLKCRRFAGC